MKDSNAIEVIHNNAILTRHGNLPWEVFSKFRGYKAFLWGHWYPCFGLLMTSSPGFKARVGSPTRAWQRHTCYTHLWCNTCWPLSGQYGSQAVLSHIPASRHWWGWKLESIMLPLPHSVRPGRCWLGLAWEVTILVGEGGRGSFLVFISKVLHDGEGGKGVQVLKS